MSEHQFRICMINGKCSDYCSFFNDKFSKCDLGRTPETCEGSGLYILKPKPKICHVCKKEFTIENLRIRTVRTEEWESGGKAHKDYMCKDCDLTISKIAIKMQTNPHPTWWDEEKAFAKAIDEYLNKSDSYRDLLYNHWKVGYN